MDKKNRNLLTKAALKNQRLEAKLCVACGEQDERTLGGLHMCRACVAKRRRTRALRNGFPPELCRVAQEEPKKVPSKPRTKNFRIPWPPPVEG